MKGRGFTEVEDREDWHGKPLPPDMAERAIEELGGERGLTVRGPLPTGRRRGPGRGPRRRDGDAARPTRVGDKVATRKAYGQALAALGARPDVVAMDGEVSNSTFADEFAHAYPERYFEMFIAEQQLVAAAVGFSVRGYRPFASTFAAFFTRAYDFIRMAAISAGQHQPVRLARRRRDRRGRPVPDGARGPGHDARGARLHRALSQRRHLHRRARRGHGRPRRHQLHAHHPRRLPGALRRRRDVPDRRLQGARAPPTTTRSPSSAPGSPCTPAWRRPTSWPPTVSAPGSSTCTPSSRSTPRP